MEMDDRDYAAITEELQRLRDEQQRLRDEQEKLRREKTPSTNGNAPATKKNADGDKDSAKGADGKDSSDDKNKAESQGDEKAKDQEKPKPPLKERAKAFVREHPKGIFWGTIGFVVLVILTIILIIYLNSYESTDDAEIDGHLNAVSSRITGTVTKVYVQDNQAVTAGQLLLELDTHDYQTALDQAQASEANALAQLAAENPNVPITQTANQTNITSGNVDVETAQAGVTAAEQQYQAKLAELRQTEANNLKAQTDVLRYRPLVEKEEISKEQFDTILAQAKTQAAGVEAAQASAKAAEKAIDQAHDQLRQALTKLQQTNTDAPRNVAIRKAGVRAREAALQAAQAQVQQARLNLSYTKIYAPVAGIIGQKNAELGQRVEIGQQLLSHYPAGRYLDHREFQGDAVEENASRAAGGRERGCVWQEISRVCGEFAGGYRSDHQFVAAGKRYGKLCEGGAEIAGADSLEAGGRFGTYVAAGDERGAEGLVEVMARRLRVWVRGQKADSLR